MHVFSSNLVGDCVKVTAFIFGELFKSHVTFLFIISLHDVPPKGDTQVEKGGGTN